MIASFLLGLTVIGIGTVTLAFLGRFLSLLFWEESPDGFILSAWFGFAFTCVGIVIGYAALTLGRWILGH